jgi:tRNA 2-thiouridine synthesizing protein A
LRRRVVFHLPLSSASPLSACERLSLVGLILYLTLAATDGEAMTGGSDPKVLDLKGLHCPLPALRTLKALKTLAPGAMLVVECTDPMSAIDIPRCVAGNGDTLEGESIENGVLRFRIRRKAA